MVSLTPLTLLANMQERSWTLGAENVDELYEYKNLGVYPGGRGSTRTTVAHLMLILIKILKKKLVRKRE